jgi:hypothetical protein
MAPAEELGLTPPQYDVVYTLRKGDEVMEVSGTDYVDQKWWEKPEWVMDAEATRTVKVAEGYEPPVHDFSIAPGGVDQTDIWLAYPESYWLVAILTVPTWPNSSACARNSKSSTTRESPWSG